MEDKKDILNKIKKSAKPDVPEDFFVNFSSNLMGKIQNEDNFDKETSVLDDFHKRKKPIIPKEFFQEFPTKISDQLITERKSKTRTIRLYVWATAISAAAVLTIFFWINRNDSNSDFVKNSIETLDNTLTENDYDAYLTYVDEGEIIDYILDNEIDFEDKNNNTTDAIYYYLEDDLEELYLEL